MHSYGLWPVLFPGQMVPTSLRQVEFICIQRSINGFDQVLFLTGIMSGLGPTSLSASAVPAGGIFCAQAV